MGRDVRRCSFSLAACDQRECVCVSTQVGVLYICMNNVCITMTGWKCNFHVETYLCVVSAFLKKLL